MRELDDTHRMQHMETPTPRANIVFGQRLRAVRKDRGWTLRVLAAKAGVHWTYLGQVERGERNVSLLTILRLSKALGIDAGVLLKGLRADLDPAQDPTDETTT